MGRRRSALEDVDVTPGFWQGKRVFLTGHTGFKGGWLSLWLQNLGAEVTGYALNPPTNPSLFAVAQVGVEMRSIIADIRDLPALRCAMDKAQPEIVFHLAAQPLVWESYRQPVETYATNVMGTAHLLEAVRQVGGIRSVVIITSDKCYENREQPWGYREDEAMGGYDPYSSSKGCAELVTAAWRRSFFNPDDYEKHGVAVASARAGNVIGGGDWAADRLIPDLIRALQAGEPMRIRQPTAIRPWQHVLEPLRGYLLLAERLWTEGPAYAEGWNFGPDEADARSVRWLAEHLAVAWGTGATWCSDAQPHPHEAHYLRLDCAKAHQRLGWQPRWNLARALAETVTWYRAEQAVVDMRATTLAQIAHYQSIAEMH